MKGVCCLAALFSVSFLCEAVEVGGVTNAAVATTIPNAPPQYRRPSDWKPTLWTQDLATVSREHSARVLKLAHAQMAKVDAVNRIGKYKATGPSIDTHRCPEWLKDAKLGIFIDWGPWSVASWAPCAKGGRFYPDGYENHCEFPLGSEPAERDALFRAYHLKNWGADFHRDHFLALFRAEAFDADALMRLFKTCGAKYVVPFLKHHGGYCLWDCPYTFRDSADQGPRRDLAREMREACRRENLKFGFYFSHGLEWGYPILGSDGALAFVNAAGKTPAPYRPEMEWTASGKVAVRDFVRDYTVPQATDFIDRYDPDLLWYDGDWVSPAAINGGYDIAAYFYNRAEGRKEVAVNDRYGFGTPDEVAHKKTTRGGVYAKFLRAVRGDFYTSETADITEDLDPASGHLWEECHGLSHAYGNHWQEDEASVMGERELIAYFTDIIARGGNLLLMVNLDGQGRLPELQRKRLTALGDWLARWGGAVYGTRACAPYSTPGAGYLQSKDGLRRFAVILDGRREVELTCAFAPDERARIFGEREALPERIDAQGRRQILIPPRWTMAELPYVLEIYRPAPDSVFRTSVKPETEGAFRVLTESSVRHRVEAFNATDDETYTNAYPNVAAADFLSTNVPRFECPDEEIVRTYYFRWWTYRKHLRRTSRGWVVSEFLPNVPWAGRENTIACPLGHHIREGRWLRDPVYVEDYLRFMMTDGTVSGPRAYVCWPAVSACDQARVTGDWSAAERLLPAFLRNFEQWERGWTTSGSSLKTTPNRQGARGVPFTAGFRAERGLFDVPGSAEGSEFALSADGARVLINAAMCAEARAIAELANRVGNRALAATWNDKAVRLEGAVKTRLWNPEKRFFCALDVAGRIDDVRELAGYAPWYFGLSLPPEYDVAFAALGDGAGFAAPVGMPSVARDTPGFDLSFDDTRHECLWNGPSWPYATSIALTALANRLQSARPPADVPDFASLLAQYARQHRMVRVDGSVVPWIDENLDPLTGEWRARQVLETWQRKGAEPPPIADRGKDYNHSTFCDLVIAGLCGIRPGEGPRPEVRPLAPPEWNWWCIDGIRYHGHSLTVLFDRDGTRYGKGKGLQILTDAPLPVTAGWENVCPKRSEVAPVRTLWTADLSRRGDFTVERRDGAEGTVTIAPDGIRIDKTNDRGYILVTARPFAAATNRIVRMFADVAIASADVDCSSGYLRAFGQTENLSLCEAAEKFSFYKGGQMTSRGMPCTAPGMTTRKYAQYLIASDGLVTPALVVAGAASRSRWRNWTFEDFDAACANWKPFVRAHLANDHRQDRISEAALAACLAADTDHCATVERRDGVSCLVIDGEVAAPVAFKARHFTLDPDEAKIESFAGKPFDGSALRLAVSSIILAGTPGAPLYWTSNGFDVVRAVRGVKSAMRAAPNTLFLVGLQCSPYPDFTRIEHPSECWLDADGHPVIGSYGSCVAGYLRANGGFIGGSSWPWVSYSSRVWREAVKARIRELVAELKREGLSERIVGIHLFGFHDLQFSLPYTDTSEPARREYDRVVATGRPASTNYDFVVKQSGFFAQEEFARAFKQALGKPSVAAIWCESPYQGARNASCFFTSFCRSDAVDIVVCQPDYRVRLPSFSCASVIPSDSFHLHGKLFWNELDLRTYGAYTLSESALFGPGALQAAGHSTDFPMWQTAYRKLIGEMDALRQGYWLYDMAGGWYDPPEIAADIRAAVAEEQALARLKPSSWRPDVAVVVDEGQFLGPEGLKALKWTDGYIYAAQCRTLAASGVPYECYLAEDVLEHPELLDGRKLVVFAFMRRIDARRRTLLGRLSSRGVAQVFLSETAVEGGAAEIGFAPRLMSGRHNPAVVPEAGVTDNVKGELSVVLDRDALSSDGNLVPRCTVDETEGVKVLARSASDRLPAIAWRDDRDCRRVYVCMPGGLTAGLFNRLAREAGAYVATAGTGLQVDMNGDFLSVHCLRAGRHVLTLPFRCRLVNLKTGVAEPVAGTRAELELTAGETCRFRLDRMKGEQMSTGGLGHGDFR